MGTNPPPLTNTFTLNTNDFINIITNLVLVKNLNTNNILFIISFVLLLFAFSTLFYFKITNEYKLYQYFVIILLVFITIALGLNRSSFGANTDIIIINGSNVNFIYNEIPVNINSHIVTQLTKNQNNNDNLGINLINDNCDVATVIYDYSNNNNGTLKLCMLSATDCYYCNKILTNSSEYKCGSIGQKYSCNQCGSNIIPDSYKKKWYNSTNNTFNIKYSGNTAINIPFKPGDSYLDNEDHSGGNYIKFQNFNTYEWNILPGMYITKIEPINDIINVYYKSTTGFSNL